MFHLLDDIVNDARSSSSGALISETVEDAWI